jgi:hypothetical protein
MARPRAHNRREVLEAFNTYIAEVEIPIVAEFATLQGVSREFLYSNEEFSDAIKRCTFKKEAALERMALTGKVNVSMAIFSLKQLGWTDRAENTLKGDPNAPVALTLNGSDVHG